MWETRNHKLLKLKVGKTKDYVKHLHFLHPLDACTGHKETQSKYCEISDFWQIFDTFHCKVQAPICDKVSALRCMIFFHSRIFNGSIFQLYRPCIFVVGFIPNDVRLYWCGSSWLCWHLTLAVFVHVFLARICICVGAPDWESAWATAYWSSPPAGGSGCDLLIQGERVWSSPLLTYWHHHHHHRHLINQSGGGNMQMCIRIIYFVVVGSITQPGPTLKICLTIHDEKCQKLDFESRFHAN